jgi:hypothetical protein
MSVIKDLMQNSLINKKIALPDQKEWFQGRGFTYWIAKEILEANTNLLSICRGCICDEIRKEPIYEDIYSNMPYPPRIYIGDRVYLSYEKGSVTYEFSYSSEYLGSEGPIIVKRG